MDWILFWIFVAAVAVIGIAVGLGIGQAAGSRASRREGSGEKGGEEAFVTPVGPPAVDEQGDGEPGVDEPGAVDVAGGPVEAAEADDRG